MVALLASPSLSMSMSMTMAQVLGWLSQFAAHAVSKAPPIRLVPNSISVHNRISDTLSSDEPIHPYRLNDKNTIAQRVSLELENIIKSYRVVVEANSFIQPEYISG